MEGMGSKGGDRRRRVLRRRWRGWVVEEMARGGGDEKIGGECLGGGDGGDG